MSRRGWQKRCWLRWIIARGFLEYRTKIVWDRLHADFCSDCHISKSVKIAQKTSQHAHTTHLSSQWFRDSMLRGWNGHVVDAPAINRSISRAHALAREAVKRPWTVPWTFRCTNHWKKKTWMTRVIHSSLIVFFVCVHRWMISWLIQLSRRIDNACDGLSLFAWFLCFDHFLQDARYLEETAWVATTTITHYGPWATRANHIPPALPAFIHKHDKHHNYQYQPPLTSTNHH